MKTSNALFLGAAFLAVNVSADDLKADLLAQEKNYWEAWGRKDSSLFLKHAAEDSIEIALAGRFIGKEAVAKRIAGHSCTLNGFEFLDANVQQLTPDVAVLSYLAKQDVVCGGVQQPAKFWTSSIYVRRGGEWLSTTYQETPVGQ